jgi:hypothetical protein
MPDLLYVQVCGDTVVNWLSGAPYFQFDSWLLQQIFPHHMATSGGAVSPLKCTCCQQGLQYS